MTSTSVSHWWKSWCCLQPWCRREITSRITFNNCFYGFVDDFLFGLLSSSTPMIKIAGLSAFRIRGLIRTEGTVRIFQHRHHCWKVLVFKVIREVVLVLKFFTVFRWRWCPLFATGLFSIDLAIRKYNPACHSFSAFSCYAFALFSSFLMVYTKNMQSKVNWVDFCLTKGLHCQF